MTFSKNLLKVFRRHPDLSLALVGMVIGLAVCLPSAFHGQPFLLDWAYGPHPSVFTDTVYGLNGGLTADVPTQLAIAILIRALGVSIATWLPIFLFFPLAAFTSARLCNSSWIAKLATALIWSVNPFVFSRLFAGHIQLLIGYALLPAAVNSLVHAPERSGVARFTPGLWWGFLTALTPQFAWIYGLVVLVFAASNLRPPAAIRFFSGAFALNVLTDAYVLLAHIGTSLPESVGIQDLVAFRTSPDLHFGLLPNVLALYGFWRRGPGPTFPKDVVPGWPLLLTAILLIAVFGTVRECQRLRGNDDRGEFVIRRRLVRSLVPAAMLALFLALGDQGPTGGLFRLAYVHVPFFNLLREPEKFSMLLALAYAVFFGWGVDHLSRIAAGRWDRIFACGAAVLLPLSYTPTIFGGLAGQIASGSYPNDWSKARQLMGSGSGQILFLPWHEYMTMSFTHGATVQNPAHFYFSRRVIQGDNIQAGDLQTDTAVPRSNYIQYLVSHGPGVQAFGALVAPLGVQFVVLAKSADWTIYRWLDKQRDLSVIFDSNSIEVWRNASYQGVGAWSETFTRATPADAVGLANREIGSAPIGVLALNALPRARTPATISSVGRSGVISALSPVEYAVRQQAAGWFSLDAPYEKGWEYRGQPGMQSTFGTVFFHTSGGTGVAVFSPWADVRVGYAISLGTLTGFGITALVLGWKRRAVSRSVRR